MAKSGFVPAWMKIPSSDKTNGSQKFTFNRTTYPTNTLGRQRHHSSDIVDQTTTRQTFFYGQSRNQSTDQQKSENTFSFQRSLNDPQTPSKYQLSNNENFPRALSSNRFLTRKDRLFSTPTTSDERNELKTNLTHEENRKSYRQLTKQTILLLSKPETSEEKDLLMRMGWNDDIGYEITDQDKEEYEKQLKLLPKTDNRSARLIHTLNRRTLPYINIRDILRLERIDSTSDDDDDDSSEE